MLTGLYACYNVYKTRDERWVSVGALEPKFWATLCLALDCEAFIPHQFAEGKQQSEMIATLSRIFMEKDAAEWFAELGPTDTCVTPVNNIVEMISDPHVRERHAIVDVEHPTAGTMAHLGIAPKLSETPGHVELSQPPRLGQHTREVLQWVGITDDEIDEMKAMRVIQE